jgi:DNA-binding FadR family transcriptional regulator
MANGPSMSAAGAKLEDLLGEMPVRTARAYDQLADVLRRSILDGLLSEGERLPSEAKLAQKAGVSRTTVREALRILQEAGLVERASPKILVVRAPGDEPGHRELAAALHRRNVTFHHLHEALMTIEPELTRLATERASDSDIEQLRQNLDCQEDNLENFERWCQLDEEFHLAIAEMSANPALIVTRSPITNLLLPVLNRFMREVSLTTHALRFHHRILGEIEARDAELAAAFTRRHIDDFRIAWEKRGLDFEMKVADLPDTLWYRRELHASTDAVDGGL